MGVWVRAGRAGLVLGVISVVMGLAVPAAARAADTRPDPTVVVSSAIPAQQAGSTYSGPVATFFASNASAFTVAIDWGDGSPLDTTTGAAGTLQCQTQPGIGFFGDCPVGEAPTGTISAQHTFTRPGPYAITVSVSGNWGYPPQGRTVEDRASSGQGTIPAVTGTCGILGSLGFAKLQMLDGGCVTTNGTTQTTDPGKPALVNGLELDPAPGTSLTLDSVTGTLSSNGGNVTIKLGSRTQHQTTFEAHPIDWRVVPNPGETSIDVGSTGHFTVDAGGTILDLPALSLNEIELIQDKSNLSFTAGVPIPSLASFFGTIKATATMLSDNASGAHFDGLDAEIGATQKPEIENFKVAAPFKAFYGHLKFTLSTRTWYVSMIFSVPGAGGISASTTITNGAPTAINFDASYKTPGLAIGDTGAFLQDIHGSFIHYPHVSHPKIGLTHSSGNAATDAARQSECATIDQYYAQYIALNTAFPSYCGAVGQVSFDPPLEVDGGVQVSAGPVIGTKSALVISGDFRYVDSYNDGTNTVPWLFNVQGGVTMLGLPFNRTPEQVYPNGSGVGKSSYVPVNNSGKQAWATIHGDGLVEAGGGFDYAFPQSTSDWFIKVNGDVGVSLVPKGAAIGAPAPGATPEQYAGVVQGHANNWSIVGTISGQVCAQIPSVAQGCATGAAGISNNGIAGCASFTIPGSQVIQAIAVYGAKAINAIAEFGQQAATQVAQTAQALADQAKAAAQATANYIASTGSNIGNSIANGATSAGNTIASGATSVVDTIASWFAGDLPAREYASVERPLAHATSGGVVNENITIPDVNYSIGALYRWSGSTSVLTTCSHDALVSALSATDRAGIAVVGGRRGVQIRVTHFTKAPRLFVITGVTGAPDVIVMGPDRRAIRTYGPGFITPAWIVYKDARHKKTYVDAVAAPTGRWDFVAAPHTSLIADVQTAAGTSIPSVKAAVRPAPHHRFTVVYRVYGRAPGDRITLQELDGSRAPVTVATLGGTHGTVRWSPSSALPGSKRALTAVVTHGGQQVAAEPLGLVNLKALATKPARPAPKRKRRPRPRPHGHPGEPPGDRFSRDPPRA